ncbi:unnamed protein product [Paramecium pentaurelia]|uniref:Uncharacterized protein n=1 Tax=Paramecium pentaurelia TaxID=43138 RepID=A0A8S1XJ85_9CILI|nr:unnamed protein product [Paramecium pentaurelia]
MSQLKFVRSKSTTRSNPLGRLKQQLKQIQKPGKLHVSVGRSRQSSQPNEELLISTPKNKMNLKLLQLHQINENTVSVQGSAGWQSLLPLSHDARIINDSNKLSNSTQYNGNWGNIYNKQHYYTQTNYCSQKLDESSKTDKLDGFQVKSTKLNSSNQQSFSVWDANNTSKFNFNQYALKQSELINQQQNLDNDQYRLYNSTHSNNNIKQRNENEMQEQIKNQQKNEKFESMILDIYHTSTNNKQSKTQPIIELNEDEEFQGMKCSTQSSQKQIPKFYSEILTDRSLILKIPKRFKETEIQTNFTQTHQIDTNKYSKLNQSCKSTTNASVQTKSKKKNLGLFQYQLSYLSPKQNKNFLDTDLLSLDDFQSQIIYESQQEDQHKLQNQYQKEIDFNNNKSQILSQKSNLYLTKQLLLDPEEDSQPFYLQAEPKEINSNLYDKKSNNQKSISKEFTHNSCTNISKGKIEKSTSFQSVNCYKDHLKILINQSSQNNCKIDQNQPYIVQENKQKYPLRSSQNNQNMKKQQRSKQTKKK